MVFQSLKVNHVEIAFRYNEPSLGLRQSGCLYRINGEIHTVRRNFMEKSVLEVFFPARETTVCRVGMRQKEETYGRRSAYNWNLD